MTTDAIVCQWSSNAERRMYVEMRFQLCGMKTSIAKTSPLPRLDKLKAEDQEYAEFSIFHFCLLLPFGLPFYFLCVLAWNMGNSKIFGRRWLHFNGWQTEINATRHPSLLNWLFCHSTPPLLNLEDLFYVGAYVSLPTVVRRNSWWSWEFSSEKDFRTDRSRKSAKPNNGSPVLHRWRCLSASHYH